MDLIPKEITGMESAYLEIDDIESGYSISGDAQWGVWYNCSICYSEEI
jgi:hypothetical protein